MRIEAIGAVNRATARYTSAHGDVLLMRRLFYVDAPITNPLCNACVNVP